MFRLIVVAMLIGITTACGGEPAVPGPSSEPDPGPEVEGVVYQWRGAIQCEDAGTPLEESAQVLIDAGIDVVWSSCGWTPGAFFATECGQPAGDLNFHKIPEQNVEDAIALGFTPATETVNPETGVAEYSLSSCSPDPSGDEDDEE